MSLHHSHHSYITNLSGWIAFIRQKWGVNLIFNPRIRPNRIRSWIRIRYIVYAFFALHKYAFFFFIFSAARPTHNKITISLQFELIQPTLETCRAKFQFKSRHRSCKNRQVCHFIVSNKGSTIWRCRSANWRMTLLKSKSKQ